MSSLWLLKNKLKDLFVLAQFPEGMEKPQTWSRAQKGGGVGNWAKAFGAGAGGPSLCWIKIPTLEKPEEADFRSSLAQGRLGQASLLDGYLMPEGAKQNPQDDWPRVAGTHGELESALVQPRPRP